MKKTSTLFLLLCMAFLKISTAQEIKGKILDAESGEALAFVNIIFNNNPHFGTVSDIDGKFHISSKRKIKSITCSYIGYEKRTIYLDGSRNREQIIIKLTASSIELQEVTIKPGINPAHRIIKKAIDNKEINHPEYIDYFKYTSYNKSIFDFFFNDSLSDDSIKIRVEKALHGGHLFLMESVTERKYIYPNLSEEVIIGTGVSGFKHPSFASLATDIQPFSFYNELISILDINYLNPISNGSIKKYNFQLKDTLYQNQDTVFVVYFEPKTNKNFDGLKGLLYINTFNYAVQNVIAEPYEKGLIYVKIQQKYQLIDGQQWFPHQLNYELRSDIDETGGLRVIGKSYIKNVELDLVLDKSDFSIDAISMHDLANQRDSSFWRAHRVEPLDIAEKNTYAFLDSIGEEHNFDGFLRFMEKMAKGKIPIGFIDLDLNKTFIYNEYESYRLGFGAYTNERISKVFSIGGFFGYGVDDYEWKYGGELMIKPNPDKELEFKLRHRNTLREAGRTSLNFFAVNPYDTRSYMAYRMDNIIQNSFLVGFRAFRYAKMNIGIHNTAIEPKYDYRFINDLHEPVKGYLNNSISLNIRYAYKEKLVNTMGQRVSMGSDYPVLHLAYSKGLKGFYEGEFEYNKVELGIEHSFLLRSLGKTSFKLDAGFIDETLPYGLLFSGEGSFHEDLIYVVKDHFQTVKPSEFLSDRYVNFFFSHSFESLLLEVGKFKPYLTVYQSMGWGELSNPESHYNIDFKTKEKGLFESGILVDDILRMNYVNIGYLGFGLGAFYRYGEYSNEKIKDNIAVKFSMTFRTR